MAAITQLGSNAVAGQRYGTFAGKELAPPTATVTIKKIDPGIDFQVGDEWYALLSGPAVDAPRVRITIRYS